MRVDTTGDGMKDSTAYDTTGDGKLNAFVSRTTTGSLEDWKIAVERWSCGQDTTGDGTIDTHLTSVQAQTLHERASEISGEQRKAQFQVRNPARALLCALAGPNHNQPPSPGLLCAMVPTPNQPAAAATA